MIRLADSENDVTRGAVAPPGTDHAEKPKVKLFDGFPRPEQAASLPARDAVPSSPAATVTLRVAEARVEDVGHAIARLAPVDLQRLRVRAGDTLKITGGATGVARAESSDDEHEGMIQIDGTGRSNCNVGLQSRSPSCRSRRSRRSRSVCRRCGRAPRQRPLRLSGCSKIWWAFR